MLLRWHLSICYVILKQESKISITPATHSLGAAIESFMMFVPSPTRTLPSPISNIRPSHTQSEQRRRIVNRVQRKSFGFKPRSDLKAAQEAEAGSCQLATASQPIVPYYSHTTNRSL
jgi:hypothetical protein